MALVIIALWLGFLWLLVRFGILKKWTLWMKLSPIAVWAIVMVLVMLPLNWVAPTGPATVIYRSVEITPNVSGIVTNVAAKSWEPLKKGDVLFRIDPTPYQAAVEQIEARLRFAELREEQKSELLERGTGRAVDVQSREAEVKQLQAQLKGAQWNLNETTVRAPFDGIVTNVVLQPGTRVTTTAAVMPFVDHLEPIVVAQIPQNYMRNIKSGDKAEVIFALYPGSTYSATVEKVYLTNASGQLKPSGQAVSVKETSSERFLIWLKLEQSNIELPAGAAGTAAIYTTQGAGTHVIRQILLRMTTWLNIL
jgi:RND family efflux transporter MFP subunit